jgi:hypothetical protein
MAGRKAPEHGKLLPFEALGRNEQLRRIARGEIERADTRGQHPHPPVPLTHPWRNGIRRRAPIVQEE